MSTDHLSTDDANSADGEGVWSPEIEQAFQEALHLFPPCGRRKHILQEEGGGKMYGRNELIARYIKQKTGKERSRKQVSSHIQVLNRRRVKAENVNSTMASNSATPSPSAGSLRITSTANTNHISNGNNNNHNGTNGNNHPNNQHHHLHHNHHGQHHLSAHNHIQHHNQYNHHPHVKHEVGAHDVHLQLAAANQLRGAIGYGDVWADRPIVTQRIRLVEFSAFIEQRSNLISTTQNSAAAHSNLSVPQSDNNMNASTDNTLVDNLSLGGHQQAAAIAIPISSYQHYHTTHPLASNHQLPAQFNQASYQAVTNRNNDHTQLPKSQASQSQAVSASASSTTSVTSATNGNNFQRPQSSHSGFIRHCYIQIDYTKTLRRQMGNKLEGIDISQIQDKFPEVGGPDGLFQRGPSDSFFLVKFWADINNDYEYNIDDQNSYFGFSSHFETVDPYRDITCSTKACSYGNLMVEKVDKICCTFNNSNGFYSYDIKRSPMCELMVQFIKKLRQLPKISQMNSVLENFTVLQVISSESTSEILLCLAYVFEVASSSEQNYGPQYHVYKLTKH